MAVTAFEWNGTVAKTVKFRVPSDSANYASEIKTAEIIARSSAPSVTGVKPEHGGGNGKLTGMTGMEYNTDNSAVWIKADIDEISLPVGKYYVRKAATSTSFASASIEASVPSFTEIKERTPTGITIDYSAKEITGFETEAQYIITVDEISDTKTAY
jgi:hypothetical protein